MEHQHRNIAGDRYAAHGAWSPPTSAMNFCEEDYDVTRYIAEFINSLTNLAYVYLALRHIYGGRGGFSKPRADFMSISLFVLGIGSFVFHASLRQNLQLVDDLSMLLLAWSMLQATLTLRQPPARCRLVNVSLAIVVPLLAACYLWSGNVLHHTAAFLFLLAVLVVRIIFLFQRREPIFAPAKSRVWTIQIFRSIIFSLAGYLLWYIDLAYCARLRVIRRQIGLPWAWLLELHGWWHILTAIGASTFMDVTREWQHEDLGVKAKQK